MIGVTCPIEKCQKSRPSQCGFFGSRLISWKNSAAPKSAQLSGPPECPEPASTSMVTMSRRRRSDMARRSARLKPARPFVWQRSGVSAASADSSTCGTVWDIENPGLAGRPKARGMRDHASTGGPAALDFRVVVPPERASMIEELGRLLEGHYRIE